MLRCMMVATVACALSLSTSALAKSPSTPPSAPSTTANMITIVDLAGAPIAGAQVMIGSGANLPFGDNTVTTDAKGVANIPSGWTNAQPVTIEATGFVRTTYFGRSPAAAVFKIRAVPVVKATFELKGETTGYQDLQQDGYIDVGLVIPSFSRAALTGFQISNLISHEVDNISVIGKQYKLPSNLSIPTQTETYLLPLTFTKPGYRMYFDALGNYGVSVVHARFLVKEIADALTNGVPILELLNTFTYVEGSSRVANIKKGSTTLALPVNDTKFLPLIQVVAPNFDNRLSMLSVAIPEANGTFSISDVKKLAAKGKVTLVAPKKGVTKGFVFNMLRAPAPQTGVTVGAQAVTYSAVITPANMSKAFDFLPIVKAPELRGETLSLDSPAKLPGVVQTMTYAVMSEVEVLDNGSFKIEKTTPEWELYANDWAQALELPTLATTLPQTAGKMRWEATFVGVSEKTASPVTSGPDALEKATHVTRAAVDF